jgi:hypothetical protein
MAIPSPYDRRYFNDVVLDEATIAAVRIAEMELGYKLSIFQGIGDASASGDTHTKGRAIDIDDWDGDRKDRVLKDLGFIGWQRPYNPGVWGAHGHYVLVFESRANQRGIALPAWYQIGAYDRQEDGLVGDGRDYSYRSAKLQEFTRDEYRRFHQGEGAASVMPETNVTQARDELVKARHNLSQAAALIDNIDPDRVVARNQLDEIKQARRDVTAILEALPQR